MVCAEFMWFSASFPVLCTCCHCVLFLNVLLLFRLVTSMKSQQGWSRMCISAPSVGKWSSVLVLQTCPSWSCKSSHINCFIASELSQRKACVPLRKILISGFQYIQRCCLSSSACFVFCFLLEENFWLANFFPLVDHSFGITSMQTLRWYAEDLILLGIEFSQRVVAKIVLVQ